MMVSYLRLVPFEPEQPPPVEWDADQALLPLSLEPPPGSCAPQRVPSQHRRRVRAALAEVLQLALEFRARRRVERAPRTRADANEPPLVYLDMPATRADCRGPGICPLFRCKHNLALRVKDSGAIKVDGGGPGTTLRPAARASARRLDRMVDAIIAKAEAIGSLCTLDLAEEDHWHDEPRYGRQRTIPEVAEILGVGEEIIRQLYLEARHELDIAQAKERRREQRALETKQPAPLVQIRRRP